MNIVILILNLVWMPFVWPGTEAFEIPATAGAVRIDVVDCGRPGEVFRVYDNGVVLGDTSPAGQGPALGNDYDACFTSGYHSVGTFMLAAGVAHEITIEVIENPYPEIEQDVYGAIRGEEIPVAPTLPVWAALALVVGLLGGAFLVLRGAA